MIYDIKWDTDQPEMTDEQTTKLAAELAYITEQLDKPSDLIFHQHWLTEDMDGPVIVAWGNPKDENAIYLSYYETTEWITLDGETTDE